MHTNSKPSPWTPESHIKLDEKNKEDSRRKPSRPQVSQRFFQQNTESRGSKIQLDISKVKNLHSSKDRPHRFNGHAFKQTAGDSDGQGSPVCCNPWDSKEAGHNLSDRITTKMKHLHSSKDTAHKLKRQAIDYEETATIHLTKDSHRSTHRTPKTH